MTTSAIFMAILGVAASFLPQEIIAHFGSEPQGHAVLLIQVAGAIYLGFAILNWMARGNLIGGIYSRPVALGNFMHFAIVAVVLAKAVMAGLDQVEIVSALIVYSVFAAWFGAVLFGSPSMKK
jgi:hypothetical protein